MSQLGIDLSDFGAEATAAAPTADQRGGSKRGRRWPVRVLRWVGIAIVAGVAPFVVLIRVGVASYLEWGWSTWPSLGLGVAATALLLGLYAWLFARRLGAGRGMRRFLVRSAMVIAGVYAAYSLVYVASRNVKTDDVRTGYRALHPLLRVASGTVVLFDTGAVITDAGRTVDDYSAMGLAPNEASLHIAGPDGRVHALDLRTRGRPEWRNRAVELYFRAMGFHTLRHVGTADHLHVSLRRTGR